MTIRRLVSHSAKPHLSSRTVQNKGGSTAGNASTICNVPDCSHPASSIILQISASSAALPLTVLITEVIAMWLLSSWAGTGISVIDPATASIVLPCISPFIFLSFYSYDRAHTHLAYPSCFSSSSTVAATLSYTTVSFGG